MSLAVYARPQMVHRLQAVLDGQDVIFAHSWQALESTLASQIVRTVVIDPGFGRARDAKKLATICKANPQTSFIPYATLDAESLQGIAVLSQKAPALAEVLIYERDFAAHRLLPAIERASAQHVVVHEVLGWLEIGIGRLPYAVSATISDLFARPARYAGASDIACAASVSLQSLYRMFEAAQLGTPKRIVTVAKLCRGYFLLKTSHNSIKNIAKRLGYERSSTFSENSIEVTGCRPSCIARLYDETELAMTLLDWLYRPILKEHTEPLNDHRRYSPTQKLCAAAIS